MTPGLYTVKIPSRLNLRVEHNVESEIISKISTGDVIYIQNEVSHFDGNLKWVKITFDEKEGWIALVDELTLLDNRQYNMAQYITPNDDKSFSTIHTLKTSWAGDGEQIQLQKNGKNVSMVKGHNDSNCNWEQFIITDNGILRTYDTSAFENQVYLINKGEGAVWIPRFMSVGQEHLFDVVMEWRYKNGTIVQGKENVYFPHYIKLENIHYEYTFDSGITLNHVAEFLSFFPNGQIFERYWFADGMGLVGWQDYTNPNRKSYISSIKENSNVVLQKENISWLPEGDYNMPEDDNNYDERLVTNPSFNGLPVKTENPRYNIMQETPIGWQIQDVNPQENAVSVLHLNGESSGWRFEPASSKLNTFSWIDKKDVVLEKGFYAVDFVVWPHGSTNQHFKFSLAYQLNGRRFTFLDSDVNIPTFNMNDHNASRLGKAARFFFELKEDTRFEKIGFFFYTDFQEDHGAIDITHGDVYKVNPENVDNSILFEILPEQQNEVPTTPEPEEEEKDFEILIDELAEKLKELINALRR